MKKAILKEKERMYRAIEKAIKAAMEKKGMTEAELMRLVNNPTEEQEELIDLQSIELGLRIAVTRIKRGLTLEELAKKAQVTIGEIQLLEAGKCDMEYFSFMRVAQALDLSSEEIFEGIGIPEKKKA